MIHTDPSPPTEPARKRRDADGGTGRRRRLIAVSAAALGGLVVALAIGLHISVRAAGSAPDAAQRQIWMAKYHRPAAIPFPESDPYSRAKVDLGRMLFWDPIVSGSRTRSCASCHNPGLSWGDGLPRAIGDGAETMPTRTPTLLDIAWVPLLGWDGKAHSLESITFTPITGPIMNRKMAELFTALAAIPGYRQAYAAAFPGGVVNRQHTEEALATFERTIVASKAPFDRWIEGDENAIDEAAKRGFDLFNGKAGCAECHSGWNFTDSAFYDVGVGKGNDIGRGRLFPNSPKLRYAFKVPTLRDVARRGPYMHNGSEPTLAAVIDLYDRGGIDRPSRSELIKPLHLTEGEKSDLIAFLKTLSGEPRSEPEPTLPR